MAHKWVVRVKDKDGNHKTNAKVSMLQETNIPKNRIYPTVIDPSLMITHKYDPSGYYIAIKPMPIDPSGDWRLIVNSLGSSIVIQPFAITKRPGGGFATTPRNLERPSKPGLEAHAVDIKTVVVGSSSTTTFEVRMHFWSEVVLVSGTQYSRAGAPLRKFAEGRRDALRAAKLLDDGAVVSIWSLDDRTVFYYLKAKGAPKKWLLGHSVIWPGTPPVNITPGVPWPSLPNSSSQWAIHIVDLYDYLNGIGRNVNILGRVREISFFSHAFVGGPILYNTFDNSNTNARDPNDFDPRVKDFYPTNMGQYSNFGNAMTRDARWHIWGCHSNPGLVVMSERARVSRKQGKSDTDFFEVRWSGKSRSEESRLNRLRVLEIHLQWLGVISNSPDVSYPGKARATLKIDTFAPLPGTWSNFDVANRRMIVDKDPHSFKLIKSYYLSEPVLASCLKLKTGIDGERYVNYKDYASVQPPTVPPRSDQYELIRYKRQTQWWTYIRFHGGKIFNTAGHAKLQSQTLNPVGSIAPQLSNCKGHRYILKMIPNTNSVGLLVIEDSTQPSTQVRVFRLNRGSSGNFDSIASEL